MGQEHKEHEKHEEKEKREKYQDCEKYEECRDVEEHDKDKDRDEPTRYGKIEKEENFMAENEMGEGMKMDGLHLKKRDLWLVAGGALGALAALGLGKMSGKVRPAAVGAVREGYAFKEWLAGKTERVKEDVEDIVAEGVHQYHSNVSASADSVKREKDILEKIEKLVDQKLAKIKTDQGEG